jgi:transcriptional regulator with XRE-family HTH domain
MEGTHPLRKWRSDQGLSQDEAAPLLGVKKPTISRWETGSRTPSLAQAAKLSETTGIPIFQFLRMRQTEAAE